MLVKNCQFEPNPPLFGAPVGSDSRWTFEDTFGIRKLESLGYLLAMFA